MNPFWQNLDTQMH